MSAVLREVYIENFFYWIYLEFFQIPHNFSDYY